MTALTKEICQQIKRISAYILVFGIVYFLSNKDILADKDNNPDNKIRVIVIDPGHGGRDPGAIGAKYMEKEIVLSIALKLGKYIEDNFDDVKVIYTRDKDEFIGLDERAQIANNNKADLFISIHANALPKSRAIGTETFVMGMSKDAGNFEIAKKENSVITLEENYEKKYEGFDPNSIDSYIIFKVVQNTYQNQSIAFAQMVQNQFENRARRINRGVKQDAFWVLWRTTMPSVLIETGFLTHPDEENYLKSEQGQDYIASAIYRAFRDYKYKIENGSKFELQPDEEITLAENDLQETDSDLLSNEIKKNAKKYHKEENTEIYFKVQILSSSKRYKQENLFFKSYTDIEEFKEDNLYKYAIGKFSTYREVFEFSREIKKDYPDGFVIAVKNGEIINVNEALNDLKKINNYEVQDGI